MASSLQSMWYRWKALRLPWRKKFLVGFDLSGNTYWEFRDKLSPDPSRMRRIVKGSRKLHHSDVQISPQWHQWLRHTRLEPPTVQEQQMDVVRQVQLKENARLADARWAAKARYIEKPKEPPRVTTDEGVDVESALKTQESARTSTQRQAGQDIPDPWEQEKQKQKQTASNPGAGWQPESWTPGAARKR